MYCFQCGEELVKGAKFCHVCGANQEEARKLFEKNFKEAAPAVHADHPASGGDTKVAYSSDPEDGKALKNYLNKVDTHVGESIRKHETLSGMQPKPKKEKAKKKPYDTDTAPISHTEPKREATPKNDAASPSADPSSNAPEKKKKSFSAIWNSFIDEEDNPYSVFGEMADRLERDQKIVDDTEADRLRLSQDVDQEPFSQTGDVSGLNKKVNELLDAQEKKEKESKLTTKGILSSFFSKNKKVEDRERIVPADTFDDTFIGSAEQKSTVDTKETILPADAFTPASHTKDEAVREDQADVTKPIDDASLKETDPAIAEKDVRNAAGKKQKKRETAAKKEAKEQTNGEKKSFDVTSLFAGLKKEKTPQTAGDAPRAKGKKHHLHVSELSDNPYVIKAYDRLSRAEERVLLKGKQGIWGLLGIGCILSTLPIFFAFGRVGILPAVFALLKVLIDLFTFFFSNNVARGNSCAEDDLRARTVDNLIHWILYLIPAGLVFFVLPTSSAMGRTVLGSVTPHFLLSILLYLWVLFLAYSSAHKILPKENSRDFLAWYGIIFVSIDLISKLFWIIAIFLTSTFA
ncbi:MAG: zinc ribbon domain-containing protein [Peptoniphilus sp.]|nr:zinc ribbon domain-containing protein [Peptoniphilus sp.]MDY3118902.1 zinc ribbon domain-containing protein [Peptoniphilus sp.]